MSEGYPSTPNLDRMLKVRDESQSQGDFVQWLVDALGLAVCKKTSHGWAPVSAFDSKLNQWLAEYHGINYNEMERERTRVLNHVREANS